MCKVVMDKTLNPGFVLYNAVFGTNPLPRVNAADLKACMDVYGIDLSEKQIQGYLDEWYSCGMLTMRRDEYYVLVN